jgi:hypothetical protein
MPRGCSPNTLSAYAYNLLHFTRFLHGYGWNYDDFTPARSLRFLEYLHNVQSRRPTRSLGPVLAVSAGQPVRRLAPATVSRALAAVSSFYEYLILSERCKAGQSPMLKQFDWQTARTRTSPRKSCVGRRRALIPTKGRRTSSFPTWTPGSRCGRRAFWIDRSNLPQSRAGLDRLAHLPPQLPGVAQAHECAHRNSTGTDATRKHSDDAGHLWEGDRGERPTPGSAQQSREDDSAEGSLRMKSAELPGGAVALFIPSSPSCDSDLARKLMIALVAGAGFEPATFGL